MFLENISAVSLKVLDSAFSYAVRASPFSFIVPGSSAGKNHVCITGRNGIRSYKSFYIRFGCIQNKPQFSFFRKNIPFYLHIMLDRSCGKNILI